MTLDDIAAFERDRSDGVGERAVKVTDSCFTALEWQAIALAERDPLSSLHAPGRLSLAMGSLFGGHVNSASVDDRLEALRCMSVKVWNGHGLTGDDVVGFLRAGFTRGQLILLSRSIERRRPTAVGRSLADVVTAAVRAVSGRRAQWQTA